MNVFSDSISDQELVNEITKRFTVREWEVFKLSALGWSCKAIGNYLSVSDKTAQSHRARSMMKLGIHTTSEVAVTAWRVRFWHASIEVAIQEIQTSNIRKGRARHKSALASTLG